jgi:hypothetical protein
LCIVCFLQNLQYFFNSNLFFPPLLDFFL